MTDPIQVLRGTLSLYRSALRAGEPESTQTEAAYFSSGSALAQVEALVDAASQSVDIGDEHNRCRICWDVWGNHEDDCELAPFKENP